MTRVLGLLDRPVVIAFGFIVILLILGGIYNQQFLSGFTFCSSCGSPPSSASLLAVRWW